MDELVLDFSSKIEHRFNDEEKNLLLGALDHSRHTHGERKRASGEPAYYHDIRVAEILLELGMDLESILAGLLHDTIEERISGFAQDVNSDSKIEGRPASKDKSASEDSKIRPRGIQQPPRSERALKKKDSKTLSSLLAAPDPLIEEQFGAQTAMIVAGVNRLSSVKAKNKTVHAAETMRKMLFALTSDIRVILVKLADKLDSMRTLKYLPEDRQKEIATECIDIYALGSDFFLTIFR